MSPSAAGTVSSVVTEFAPDDSPKSVTLPGSPPNARMLRRTHSSAATWSRRPRLHSNGCPRRRVCPEVEPSERAEAVVQAHVDDPVATHEPLALLRVLARRADAVRPAVEEHHDGSAAGRDIRFVWSDHVDAEAVLAALQARRRADELPLAVLRGDRAVARGVAHAVPAGRGQRRPESPLAGGRGRIRDAPPPTNAVAAHTANRAAVGLDEEAGVGDARARSVGAAPASWAQAVRAGLVDAGTKMRRAQPKSTSTMPTPAANSATP